VRYFWSRYFGALIGIDCGKSGLLVIDADRNHGDGFDGVAALDALYDAHGEPLPCPAYWTPRGGLHIFQRQQMGHELGNREGALPPGINIRGVGGFVATGVTSTGEYYDLVTGAMELAPAYAADEIPTVADWLVELIERAPVTEAYIRPDRDPSSGEPGDEGDPERSQAWAIGALRKITNRLARTREGARNAALNSAVATLAGISWCGLSEIEIRDAMLWACEINGYIASDGLAAFEATWRSAWTFGLSRPLPGPRDREPDPVIAGFVEKLNRNRCEAA
jgi:hypothetical protein